MVWREQFKPLQVELWLRELDRLANFCENAADDDDERAVRRAFHLAMLAPLAIRRLSMPTIPLSELDLLLDDGRTEAAAKAAIASNASITVERSAGSGRWMASYGIGGDGPVRSEAPTAVAAMIRAWATFFRKAAD